MKFTNYLKSHNMNWKVSEFNTRTMRWYVEKNEAIIWKERETTHSHTQIQSYDWVKKRATHSEEVYPIINFKVDDQPEHETD